MLTNAVCLGPSACSAISRRAALIASLTLLCGSGSNATAEVVESRFDSSDEGWRLVGDTTTSFPSFVATGGNPGGFLRGFDQAVGGRWYWSAPVSYLGNISGAYGNTLTFDLRMRGSGTLFEDSDIVLIGSSGSLHFDFPNVPSADDWTSYSALIAEGAGWHLDSLSGPLATQSEIQSVLANVTSLRIRGEFITGDDNGDLDNVVLNGIPSPAATSVFLVAGFLASTRRRTVR